MNETGLLRQIKHELNSSGRCRLLRNNVGVDTEQGIRFGLGNGSADLVGVLVGGHALAIEVKRPGSRPGTLLRPDQVSWWRAAYKWGVRGGVARSLPGAWRLLEEAEAGQMTGELRDYE